MSCKDIWFIIPKDHNSNGTTDLKLFYKGSFIIILFLVFSFKTYSQQTVSGVPFSVGQNIDKLTTYELMPSINKSKKSFKAEAVSSRLKKLEFAHVFDLAFNPENSGEWIEFDNGDRLWRIGIVSPGAYSINLIFGSFNLKPDVKLYIYSPTQNNILGAYSSLNNNDADRLAIEPLPGDSVIIEMNIPASAPSYGNIELSKFGHDYVDIINSTFKSSYGISSSGACNVDINCDDGKTWQREKYAVCKIIIEASELCTGTLLNNTSLDETPYIITANHCIDTSSKANNSVFIFNYEKWKCNGENGPKPITLSGSMLVATTPKLDFSLVKLYSLPPFQCRPYLAGWDRSILPASNTAIIHHPNGDFKKLSIDKDAPVSASFPEDYNTNTHWLINKWETGTTERGSSGGPLFNQDHLLVGDLTGGDANCTLSVRDYFAKLYNSWADYSEAKHHLKSWLDPTNTNVIKLQGLDPYEAELASCDTFSNVAKTETTKLLKNNVVWGYISGHSSSSFTQFAEKINIAGALKIPGFYFKVAKAYNASNLSYITIKLWKGGDVPGAEITTRSVYIKDLTVDKENYLSFDSTLFVNGPVYLGYSINYSTPTDTFAVYQAQDRGAGGTSTMFMYKNGVWKNITDATLSAIHSSLDIGMVSCSLLNGISDNKIEETKILSVYPNPVNNGSFDVELPYSATVSASVYDISGKAHPVNISQSDSLLHVEINDLPSGVYMLKILIPGKGSYNAKFLVIK
jgi:hypothetical protein